MRLTLYAPLVAISFATPLTAAKADVYTFTTLVIPAASPASVFTTEPEGINNSGQVVGSYGTDVGGINGEQGFLLNLATGSSTTLRSPGGLDGLLGNSINDTGQIIVNETIGSGFETMVGAPFLLDTAAGTFTSLSYPSYPTYFHPAGINNIGQIIGNISFGGSSARDGPFHSQGYLRDTTTGASITFADPLAPNNTGATGFNDHGQVVGIIQVGSNDNGYLFDVATGSYTPLNDPLGTQTIPTDINNLGQVGGYFFTGFTYSGFVFNLTTGTYTTLMYPGAIDTDIQSINDAGQVVGDYRTSDNVTHAFLATPITAGATLPEPASVTLLGTGLLVLGWARFRRRRTGDEGTGCL